jgi:hypothetical protein
MRPTLSFAWILLASINSVLGVTLSFDINSPEDCGQTVGVETRVSRSHKGLVAVSVTFTPTVPDSYQGRVKAFGELLLKSGEATLAVSKLESTQKNGVFTFTFELAPEAFRNSELTLTSQLYEKDGMATLGGGMICRLHLEGFQPGNESTQPRK